MSSEPLSQRVWQALTDKPAKALQVATAVGEERARVDNILRHLSKAGAAHYRKGGGFVRGDSPPRRPGKPKSRVLNDQQRAILDRCASLYGATVRDVAAATGLPWRKVSEITENLVRRRVLTREPDGGWRSRYRLTEFGWELLTAEVAHAQG